MSIGGPLLPLESAGSLCDKRGASRGQIGDREAIGEHLKKFFRACRHRSPFEMRWASSCTQRSVSRPEEVLVFARIFDFLNRRNWLISTAPSANTASILS